MKNIWKIICDYAYLFMTGGMVLAIIGVLILVQKNYTGISQPMATTFGIVGIALYVFGRIAFVFKGKREKRKMLRDE